MVDYASTKGAIVGFTRSLASQLVSKGIRVNAVAYVYLPCSYSSFLGIIGIEVRLTDIGPAQRTRLSKSTRATQSRCRTGPQVNRLGDQASRVKWRRALSFWPVQRHRFTVSVLAPSLFKANGLIDGQILHPYPLGD